jgi:hypothetical protein
VLLLAEAAAERGVRTFSGSYLAGNRPVAALIEDADGPDGQTIEQGIGEFSVALAKADAVPGQPTVPASPWCECAHRAMIQSLNPASQVWSASQRRTRERRRAEGQGPSAAAERTFGPCSDHRAGGRTDAVAGSTWMDAVNGSAAGGGADGVDT